MHSIFSVISREKINEKKAQRQKRIKTRRTDATIHRFNVYENTQRQCNIHDSQTTDSLVCFSFLFRSLSLSTSLSLFLASLVLCTSPVHWQHRNHMHRLARCVQLQSYTCTHFSHWPLCYLTHDFIVRVPKLTEVASTSATRHTLFSSSIRVHYRISSQHEQP